MPRKPRKSAKTAKSPVPVITPMPNQWDCLPAGGASLPYTIATLCDLRDKDGNILLLHRHKHPNKHLYSPVGGKLSTRLGESPARCAQREIEEETGLSIPFEHLHLAGIISEEGYNGAHWLMFWFRVTVPVELEPHEIREGRLEWHPPEALKELPLPPTDREVIWPLAMDVGLGFFSVHIDCRGETITHRIDERIPSA